MKFLGLLVALFILVGSLCGVVLPLVNAKAPLNTILPVWSTTLVTTTTTFTTTFPTITLTSEITSFSTTRTNADEITIITTTTTTDVTELTVTTSSKTTSVWCNTFDMGLTTSSLVTTTTSSTSSITITTNTVFTVCTTYYVGGGSEAAQSMVDAANVLAELLVLVALILGLYGVQRGEFDTKAFLGLVILIAVLVLFSAIVGNF